MTADKLRAVLSRVEALKGPLTRGEAEMLADKLFEPGSVDRVLWQDVVAAVGGGREALGAVVALVEREMPGHSRKIETTASVCRAAIWAPPEFEEVAAGRGDKQEALALLAAYLCALIAEAEQAAQRAGKAS